MSVASIQQRQLINEMERLIRRDPARRGLIGTEAEWGPLCSGHLAEAAIDLAERATSVALVSGFFVPEAVPPAAETDGPPGAIVLAFALQSLGLESVIVTDPACFEAIRTAARAAALPEAMVQACPWQLDNWLDEFFNHPPGNCLSHLIAIERPGPSHTPESLQQQRRSGPPPFEQFRAQVPADCFNRCHDMRGRIIDDHLAPLHRLFEQFPKRVSEGRSIGIGDGGNEIGMGTIPWEELQRRLELPEAGRIPCRIATDWTLLAGTSNWGASALAAALLVLANQQDALRDWDSPRHWRLLETIVREGPAVDGVTGRQEPTVDGLPFDTYIQPWEGIRRLLGFQNS